MKLKISTAMIFLCALRSCVISKASGGLAQLRKISAAIVILCALCSCADAAISQSTVNEAWLKISRAEGFPVVQITFEKSTSPNAWVAFKSEKDFSVHVTQGLMDILNKEDEIAGVLGHEIGHVRLGHYNKGVGRKVGWTLLGMALGRAGGVAQALGGVGMNLAESGFSRGQEVEADDYGTELLKKAGYDPYGLYRAMKAFSDNKIITEPNGFNSHPPTARRLQHLREKAKAVSAKK